MAAPQLATPQAVMSLVGKLTDPDPDCRFMSLNDLLQLLSNAKSDFLHHDYNTAARAVDSIIKTLDDQNGEVQNLAIKWSVPIHLLHIPCLASNLIPQQPWPSRGKSPLHNHRPHD